MIVKINDLLDIYNNEIVKRVKNRKKILAFEKYFYSIQNYKHSYSFVNKDKLKHIINRYY